MELYSHADPYKCYLHHPTPEVGPPSYPKGASLEEYYGPNSNGKVVDEVKRLFKGAFRTQIIFGQRHFAPSASWRDEHVATQSGAVEPSRFAVRVHVFEERCSPGRSEPQAGRYLGFVALRPDDHQAQDASADAAADSTGATVHADADADADADANADADADADSDSEEDSGYEHVVEAEVTSPPHMHRPRYHLIMTNSSSARMGVLPFKSAVYMAPHRHEGRTSTCVHLAISQALHLVMSRFGCRPISQREFDAYVWMLRCKKHQARQPNDAHWPLLKHVGAVHTDGPYADGGGAQLTEALEVMSSCSAGGFVAHFSEENYDDKNAAIGAAWRCLTDVLANGLPVVMMVNHRLLASTQAALPHAQLVFGMRLLHCQSQLTSPTCWEEREDRAELPGEFIGHDVIKGPFFETQAHTLLEAAWNATIDLPAEQQTPGINFLVVGPSALSVDMRVVTRRAHLHMFSLTNRQGAAAALLMDYYTAAKLCPKWRRKWLSHKTDWRYVTRFMGREELLQRPGLDLVLRDRLPHNSCFWVAEVWHPLETHSLRSSPTTNPPPPVLVFGNAGLHRVPAHASELQEGVLHWSFKSQSWVLVDFNQ